MSHPYRVRREEMLRYLGHHGQRMDAALTELVEECALLCERQAAPRTVWRRMPVLVTEQGVRLGDSGVLLEGDDIARHLSQGDSCILMAATLGIHIDRLVRQLQASDLTRSVLVDAAASSLIEVVCDALEAELRTEVGLSGESLNFRYSPGYGDLPLTTQPHMLRLLDAPRRIGLHCNRANLLLPRKSVTAILAVLPAGSCEQQPRGDRCATCNLRDSCPYCEEQAK